MIRASMPSAWVESELVLARSRAHSTKVSSLIIMPRSLYYFGQNEFTVLDAPFGPWPRRLLPLAARGPLMAQCPPARNDASKGGVMQSRPNTGLPWHLRCTHIYRTQC